MKNTFSLRARDHIGTSDGKKFFNARHFAESAPRYDIATRALSFGQDASWKRKLIDGLPDVERPVCADIACGTGDLTFLLAERYPGGKFVGIDLTPEMIQLAEQRNRFPEVRFECGDMSRLPFADQSIDILTGGYAIRNAPSLGDTLSEFHRVMKPGGTLAFLDFSKPETEISQALQFQMLRFWGGLWGVLLHGNPEVHGYISESLKDFPDSMTLEKTFQDLGFEVVRRSRYFGGMMAQYFLTV